MIKISHTNILYRLGCWSPFIGHFKDARHRYDPSTTCQLLWNAFAGLATMLILSMAIVGVFVFWGLAIYHPEHSLGELGALLLTLHLFGLMSTLAVGVMLGIGLFLLGLFVLLTISEWYDDKRKNIPSLKKESKPNIIVEMYYGFKDKYCPTIIIERNENKKEDV